MSAIQRILTAKTQPASCDLHGTYISRQIFGAHWTGCPTCASEADAREQVERERRERADAQERWKKQLGRAGIPERFQNRTLESFLAESDAQRRALTFATDYAENFDDVLHSGRSALLLGPPGTGKTHLAAGIGHRIMRDGKTVLFTTVLRAIRRIKDTWSKDSIESETDAIAALTYPDLLILDEVGVQFGSDTEKLMLFDVINERYENRRPTLLLSNSTLNEVKAYLGERIFDRLREDGGEVVVFDGESHRKNGRLKCLHT